MKYGLFIALFLSPIFSLSIHAAEKNIWYFAQASDQYRQGFIRVTNVSPKSGEVTLYGVDHKGKQTKTVRLKISPRQTITLNSMDIEFGNQQKGLSGGIGAGASDWRLVLNSHLDIDINGYERTADGLVTSLHDVVGSEGNRFEVPMFNPGSNHNQESVLRVYNISDQRATIKITGVDDSGKSFGPVILSVMANHTVEIGAEALEKGSYIDLSSGLGNGSGKWRLFVTSSESIRLLNLLKDPNGHVTNLSTKAASAAEFSLHSTSFKNGAMLPKALVCIDQGGHNQSPDLFWQNAPVSTETFALVVNDEVSSCSKALDVCPQWSVTNIPAGTLAIGKNVSVSSLGATENVQGYHGPCSSSDHPSSVYSFTIYALGHGAPEISTAVLGKNGMRGSQFESQYSAYILDKATLVGISRSALTKKK